MKTSQKSIRQEIDTGLEQASEAYEAAQKIEDVNERRRQAATPLRDMRYFAARVRTAQVITSPGSTDTVAFGSTVTFRRDDGRVQKYRIVGEDEADPKAGSISFISPAARLLMGRAIGDEVGASGQKLEIVSVSYTSHTGRSRCLEWPLCARTGRSLIRHYGLGALQLYADDCVTSCCNCMGRSRITGATRQWRRRCAVQQIARSMQDGSKGSVQTVTHVSSLRAGVAINPIAILISLPPRPVQFCR